jgi:hypothetical protein
MMKTILSIGSEDKDLELDRSTANGGYFVLDLLQATLFDPATVEDAQAKANVIQSRSKEARRRFRAKNADGETLNIKLATVSLRQRIRRPRPPFALDANECAILWELAEKWAEAVLSRLLNFNPCDSNHRSAGAISLPFIGLVASFTTAEILSLKVNSFE